ncbi:MAG: transporter [Rhodocyclaceae bacterium]|nr:MAG: transporter [Rhodocyclaceae bacterium]
MTGLRITRSTAAIPLCVAMFTLLSEPVAAQDATSPVDGTGKNVATEVSQLRAKVTELEQQRAEAIERVDDLLARVEMLEMRLEAVPITEGEALAMRGRYSAPTTRAVPADPAFSYWQGETPQQGLQGSSGAPGREETDDRKAPAPTEAVVEVAQQRQGRFGDRVGLELGLDYSHFDNARINLNGFLALDAIFLGTISIDQVTADIFSVTPALRVGVTDRLIVSAEMPYLYRISNFRSGGAGGNASGLVEKTVRYDGFGDMTAGASYRLFRETAGRPDLVINARVKAPTGKHPFGVELIEVEGSQGNLSVPSRLSTGSGVWGMSSGLSALKTIDPLVVFGSLTYFRNFQKGFKDIDEAEGMQPGRVDIGDAFQVGAGVAFALNEKSSISLSYNQRLVQRTRIRRVGEDWRNIIGSQANVGFVNIGATFSLGRHLSLISTVGVGLTEDSPDLAVSVRLPYRF